MFGLIKEFMKKIKINNNQNVKHILATERIYTSEDLLNIDEFYWMINT